MNRAAVASLILSALLIGCVEETVTERYEPLVPDDHRGAYRPPAHYYGPPRTVRPMQQQEEPWYHFAWLRGSRSAPAPNQPWASPPASVAGPGDAWSPTASEAQVIDPLGGPPR